MLLFRSEEHVDRWCQARDMGRGALMTSEQCWQLAVAWYRHRLRPDWRRFTLEETEAIFSSLGLDDSFWNLR